MKRIHKSVEDEIVQQALDALGKHILVGEGPRIESLAPSNQFPLRPNRLLQVVLNQKRYEFCVEIKTVMTLAHLMMLQFVKDDLPYPLLVIGKYVNPRIADKLKALDISFIDTAGNAFICLSSLYVFIRGNKAAEIRQQQKQSFPSIRTFKPTGLKIIYAFLCHPGLEKKTYREIASVSDVALGTVNWIKGELEELGYLLNRGSEGQQLIQKDILLRRWTTIYPDQLRPKQILGRYRAERDWWEKKALNPDEAQWGGEVAAAKLAYDVVPQSITIYATSQGMSKILGGNDLTADEDGNVEILGRFWGNGLAWPVTDTVCPVLIYADLLAAGSRKSMEAAGAIYQNRLLSLLGEK